MKLECSFNLVGEKGLTYIKDEIPPELLDQAESMDQIKSLYLKFRKIPYFAVKSWELIPLDDEAKGLCGYEDGFQF